MANSAIAPAIRRPDERKPRPHDRFLAGFWSGNLDLVLEFSPQNPLVAGAGWQEPERHVEMVFPAQAMRQNPRARRSPPREEIHLKHPVSEIVRRDSKPVLPGSSLKGAVRQIYELFAPSCAWRANSCMVKPSVSIDAARICSTCFLFGANGFKGRIAFREGMPIGRPKIEIRQVPLAWPPRNPVPGHLRVYDDQRDRDQEGRLRSEQEKVFAASGRFKVRLTLMNLDRVELGLLFASLGLGWNGPGPSIRVGGKKYHGFGAAKTLLIRAEQRSEDLCAPPLIQQGQEAAQWALALRDEVLDAVPARMRVWQELHEKLARAKNYDQT